MRTILLKKSKESHTQLKLQGPEQVNNLNVFLLPITFGVAKQDVLTQ